jgi:hypothetical protein
MRPPKIVTRIQAPKPISADVAAWRTRTDRSIPNASQSDT